MTPEKCRAAMVRGLHKLSPRIKELKAKLHKLEAAQLQLVKQKWDAETEMVGVRIIPIGVGRRKLEQEEVSMEKKIEGMSAESATELLAILERRLTQDAGTA